MPSSRSGKISLVELSRATELTRELNATLETYFRRNH